MKRIETTLEHRLLMPENPGVTLHPAILMLHGRGSDEDDLLSLAQFLDRRFLLISARAPYPFPNGGYTWYELQDTAGPDHESFMNSYRRLSRFLDDIIAGYPVDPAALLLFGFSMGTVMSYALGLTRPERIRGVAANSGYIPENTHLTFRWKELSPVQFCVAHGIDDQVIPLAMAQRARELLTAAEVRLFYREYPMGHQISEQSIADVAAWMAHLL